MDNDKNDHSVLNRINDLVKEEERPYGQNKLARGDQQRLDKLKWSSISAGTC